MDRFEYVMVLVSIIVGLSIAHVLLSVGRLIDRWAEGAKVQLGWARAFWLGYVFLWTIQFWWWEFRFSELNPTWTLGLYLFLVSYSIVLFLLAVIPVGDLLQTLSTSQPAIDGARGTGNCSRARSHGQLLPTR